MAYDSSKPVTSGALVAADIRENFRALKDDQLVAADKVDTFHASQTPGANLCAVADANGILPLTWLQPVAAGNQKISSNPGEKSTTSTTYAKLKQTKIGRSGTYRIVFSLKTLGSQYPAYGRIYRNGAAVGTERSVTGTNYVVFSEDIGGWSVGDYIEIWGMATNADAGAYVTSLQLYVDNPFENAYGEY